MTEYDIDYKNVFKNKPETLKRVRDNLIFKKYIQENRVDPKSENVKVFGVKNVNINAILKDNLWDRSIFTTDKLCRMFLSCTLEQLKKYERKKRAVPMNMLWIVAIIIGVILVVIVILFLLPKFVG
jgi:hypothetical protein